MFTVLNQVSGKSFKCGDEESVLDGALSNGFNFPYGCQNGFCGQCKAVILNGEIDYDGEIPSVLSADDIDSNMALLCQCKAKSDLYIAVDELDSLAAIEVRSMPCRVEQINHLNHDVIQLILKIPGAQSLQYLAGQYLDLEHSDFESRYYSIANAPTNSNLIELHIRLVDDGKLTNFIFNSLAPKSILRIEDSVMETLSQTPPELAADIYNTGIYLAGGGSMLRGLDKRLSKKTDLPVYIAEDPLRAVVRGTGIVLKNLPKYKSVLIK